VNQNETDVLVIGSGGAGLRAAIEASKHASVQLISKGPMGRGGATVLAGADIMADGRSLHKLGYPDDPSDTPEAWARDIVIEGFGLNDENLVEAYVHGAGPEIADLVEWGLSVRKTFNRAVITSGASICASLRRRLTACGDKVELIDRMMVIDLLLSDGGVVGAIGFDIASGEFHVFRAKRVILATGGWHQAYAFNAGPDELTGDGQGMAYRAGAELVDMEMVTFAPNILLAPPKHRGSLWFYVLPGALLNANGDAFLAWEDPKVAKLALTSEWNKLLFSKAAMREVRAGRGTPLGGVYFSMKHLPTNIFDALEEEHKGWRFQGDDFSDLMNRMRDGLAVEVAPAAEYFEGGIRINERCESSLEGLYAAGECTGGLFGANRVSAATTEMLVEGTIAGDAAGRAAAEMDSIPDPSTNVEKLIAASLAPLERSNGLSVRELRTRLQEMAYQKVGVIRNGSQLDEAVSALEELEAEVEKVSVRTKRRRENLEWCETIELRNMVQSVRLSALSALERTESRGVHMREDYPVVDNRRWRKHIVIRSDGSGPSLFHEPVRTEAEVPSEVIPYEVAIVQAAEALLSDPTGE